LGVNDLKKSNRESPNTLVRICTLRHQNPE
jgi:hypothetical protein